MKEFTPGIRMLSVGVCCGLLGLAAVAPADAALGAFGEARKGHSIWSFNPSADEEWGTRESRTPERGSEDDYYAHTDQPREIGQGTQSPPESDKGGEDDSSDGSPDGDAKSRDNRSLPVDDLIFIEDGPLLGDLDKIGRPVDLTPIIHGGLSDEGFNVDAVPNNLPAPGPLVLFGLGLVEVGEHEPHECGPVGPPLETLLGFGVPFFEAAVGQCEDGR
ncbi:MAG: hypothetical protein KDA21_12570, partial [Phycisphaerales bacterium]|nr:hypothetical protein [Phycisphaerales bacterium]